MLHLILSTLTSQVSAQGMSGSSNRCTFHDYESYQPLKDYDNSPGWCGVRYSQLNVARITAVNGLNANGCNQCLEVTGPSGTVYILAVDTKADEGLDIARSSFAQITSGNVLDPVSCSWKVVDPSMCGTICYGSARECSPGVRNLLPGYLLDERPVAPQGLDSSVRSSIVWDNTDDNSAIPQSHEGVTTGVTTTHATRTRASYTETSTKNPAATWSPKSSGTVEVTSFRLTSTVNVPKSTTTSGSITTSESITTSGSITTSESTTSSAAPKSTSTDDYGTAGSVPIVFGSVSGASGYSHIFYVVLAALYFI